MFCIKCGKENSDEAVYCQKCGALLEPEDETRIAKRESGTVLTADKERIFSIAPTLKFVYAGYVVAVFGAFLIVGLISIFFPAFIPTLVAVIVGLLLLLIPAYFHVRQKLVNYTLTDTTIEIDKGLISRTTQNVPLRRIQDVTVTATLLQRMLGFGDITIDNASEDGGKVILDNIDSPKKYADLMLRQMRLLDK